MANDNGTSAVPKPLLRALVFSEFLACLLCAAFLPQLPSLPKACLLCSSALLLLCYLFLVYIGSGKAYEVKATKSVGWVAVAGSLFLGFTAALTTRAAEGRWIALSFVTCLAFVRGGGGVS